MWLVQGDKVDGTVNSIQYKVIKFSRFYNVSESFF